MLSQIGTPESLLDLNELDQEEIKMKTFDKTRDQMKMATLRLNHYREQLEIKTQEVTTLKGTKSMLARDLSTKTKEIENLNDELGQIVTAKNRVELELNAKKVSIYDMQELHKKEVASIKETMDSDFASLKERMESDYKTLKNESDVKINRLNLEVSELHVELAKFQEYGEKGQSFDEAEEAFTKAITTPPQSKKSESILQILHKDQSHPFIIIRNNFTKDVKLGKSAVKIYGENGAEEFKFYYNHKLPANSITSIAKYHVKSIALTDLPEECIHFEMGFVPEMDEFETDNAVPTKDERSALDFGNTSYDQ